MISKKHFLATVFLLAVTAHFIIFFNSASADTIGQGQSFFISSQYDIKSRASVSATLRHISVSAYFYVADDYWNSVNQNMRDQILAQTESLAREFDSRIYPIETQFFGSEPNPGIDNDSRITILLAPLIQNAGGYFDTAHQYSKSEVKGSNEREMIFLNISEINNQAKMRSFLAHEFQHLISFNQKEKLRGISDDIWLNELRSEYAVTLLGYNEDFSGSHLERRARALDNESDDSLTEWKNLPADYGQIGMLGEYIASNWSPRIIADTLKNNKVSIASLNEALNSNGFPNSFLDVYRGWLVANIINDVSENPKFGYARADLAGTRIVPTKVINNLGDEFVAVNTDSIKDWQGKWYDISDFADGQGGVLKIDFTSPSLTSFDVIYVIFRSDGMKQVYTFSPKSGSSSLYLPGVGSEFNRVIIMPIKKDKLASFGSNEPPVLLTLAVERLIELPDVKSIMQSVPFAPGTQTAVSAPLPDLEEKIQLPIPDGSLIRARGDFKVYVIRGGWRRHIIDQKIFSFYPGLGFERVIEVEPSVLSRYRESNLIRYAGSQSVHSVENGQRRWLNISAEQFTISGRTWDSIFTVNLPELQFYKTGSNLSQ